MYLLRGPRTWRDGRGVVDVVVRGGQPRIAGVTHLELLSHALQRLREQMEIERGCARCTVGLETAPCMRAPRL